MQGCFNILKINIAHINRMSEEREIIICAKKGLKNNSESFPYRNTQKTMNARQLC